VSHHALFRWEKGRDETGCIRMLTFFFFFLFVPPARHVKQAYSKKYGVHLARFTHKNTAVVHASTKGNGALFFPSFLARPRD
jgi:hypothetical protein